MEIAKESCQDRYRRRSREGEKAIIYKISSGKHIDDLYNYKIENILMYGKSAKNISFIFSLQSYSGISVLRTTLKQAITHPKLSFILFNP